METRQEKEHQAGFTLIEMITVIVLLGIIAGPDPRDDISLHQPLPTLTGWSDLDLSELKIGVYWPWFRHADADGPRAKVRQDTSLQVIACPGRLREVETVYQRILFYLERDPDLKLTDIAVLVPDMGAYKPVIDAVFQRSPRQLSYSLVDTLAETESHYGRGVLALLDLMTGRFTRAEVLGLMKVA